MQGSYKNRKMSAPKRGKTDTRIKIELTNEQHTALLRIAERAGMDVNEVVKRYVCRLIADRSQP